MLNAKSWFSNFYLLFSWKLTKFSLTTANIFSSIEVKWKSNLRRTDFCRTVAIKGERNKKVTLTDNFNRRKE